MARIAMNALISLVRGLINDPLSSTSKFTDDEIEAQLDLSREWKVELLSPLPQSDGSRFRWQARSTHWEEDVELTNAAGSVITPEQANAIAGYFVFAESQDAVTAAGFVYDVYAAAAELLTILVGRVGGQDITKFSADGSSYEFSGEAAGLMKQAESYRALSKTFGGIKPVKMVRDDTY